MHCAPNFIGAICSAAIIELRIGMTMTEQPGPYGNEKFAAKRSHQDSSISNENIRAAAQAAVLINGGAATAVVAFLAKDKIDPYLLKMVPFALAGYAAGVFFGACMMFFSGLALNHWGLAWRSYMVDKQNVSEVEEQSKKARNWHCKVQISFWAAMLSFVFASIWLMCVLSCAHRPI
jgi:hypothetical protein